MERLFSNWNELGMLLNANSLRSFQRGGNVTLITTRLWFSLFGTIINNACEVPVIEPF